MGFDLRARPARAFLLSLAAATVAAMAPAWPVLAVSATDLVERGADYDGQQIVYRGEVIGDVMRRGRVAVVNVLDGTYAVGVWIPVRAAAVLTRTGRYGVVGDVVEVRGTFRRACPEHGGDSDIHAEILTVLTPGKEVREVFDTRQALLAAVLAIVALCLAAGERHRTGKAV